MLRLAMALFSMIATTTAGMGVVAALTAGYNTLNPILIAANRDPRMEHAYIKLLNGFKQVGGKLFMAFSSPRANAHFGFWGVKEHINQNPAQAPKIRALMRF